MIPLAYGLPAYRKDIMTQDTFNGLAFPVIRARYNGPTDHRGSRYSASLRRSSDETVRASVSYDDGLSPSENAYGAARLCWEKYRAAHAEVFAGDEDPRIFIPGDLDASSYSFTIVPAYFFDWCAA